MKIYKCACCMDELTETDIKELREIGEHCHKGNNGFFLCPDCYATLNELEPMEQLKKLLEYDERGFIEL